MSAGHCKLDNLIAIVDVNNRRPTGRRRRSWTSSRWSKVRGVRLARAARRRQRHRRPGRGLRRRARPTPSRKPRMIICDTQMAKGVPFLEQRERNHFLRVEPHEWQQALAALDAGRP